MSFAYIAAVQLALLASSHQAEELPAPPPLLSMPLRPATAPSALWAAPASQERAEVLTQALDHLSRNLISGHMDYQFNDSGNGVLYSAAGLAFLGTGSTLEQGPYKKALKATYEEIDAILQSNHFQLQPVWGCGASACFLAELHRTSSNKAAIKRTLSGYCEKLIKSQTSRGSWCHTFEDKKNELNYDDLVATTALALQGLGMARREDCVIPQEVIDKGIKYIEQSSNVGNGVIGYSPREGQKGMPGPGRTGMGLQALISTGQPSPLLKSAARYLKSCFSDSKGSQPYEALQTGHASAQIGLAWTAWWAGENGCYDAFWAGQGEAILKRHKGKGRFDPAPSDGKADPGSASDGGDMAVAMHALMLASGNRLIYAGKGPALSAQASDLIAKAQEFLETWKGEASPALQALAAMPEKSPAPAIIKSTQAFLAEQQARDPVKGGTALASLLGLQASLTATLSKDKRSVIIEGSLPMAALPVKLSIKPSKPEAYAASAPLVKMISTKTSPIKFSLTLKPGTPPPQSVELELDWSLNSTMHKETLNLPLG